ncbi:MAG TPA: energy transducer TonB [Bryobacteraceae bacterium]|jgi:TonB family protein|nr:energy transducer TonB [Bryobacteraceae bacterium]
MRIGVISAGPPVGSAQIALLEQQVSASQGDLGKLEQLLTLYAAASTQPGTDYRVARLNQIRYLVNEAPASALAGSTLAFVGSANGPYPDPVDHAALASLWFAQANSHFDDTKILLNAIRFLSIEDKPQAENLYTGAVAARPDDVEVVARLGFFYAAGLVGADTMDGRVLMTRPPAVDSNWTDHCRAQLDSSTNPHVLTGAAIALPNLAMRRTGGGPAYEAWVKYSEELRTRAAALDRGPAGPRPMPAEFGMFATESSAAAQQNIGPPRGIPAQAPPTPAEIRVGPNVQAANLILNPAPVYPPLALQARVEGAVRFEARIAPDGTLKSLQLVSGPPLLVQAAMQAVQQWRWKPTLLNGQPVGVLTTIDIPFTLPGN